MNYDDEKPKPKKQPRGKKSQYYVNPDEFEQLIVDFYDSGIMTEKLGDCVFKIATKISCCPNFINYSYRQEMISDAAEKMVLTLNNQTYKHDPTKVGKNGKKGTAFMYFSRIAWNAMINRIKIEQKNRDAIDDYKEEMFTKLLQVDGSENMIKPKHLGDDEEYHG